MSWLPVTGSIRALVGITLRQTPSSSSGHVLTSVPEERVKDLQPSVRNFGGYFPLPVREIGWTYIRPRRYLCAVGSRGGGALQ